MTKGRIFSGIQPTGTIHIGNYIGAIKNWITLTDTYDCVFSIVDYHAITIDYDVESFQKSIMNAARTLIACGLDPEKCRLFVQSRVIEHTELAWILNCITPLGDLERMTQFRDKSKQHRENINVGLLAYPVLQAADIMLYKSTAVPVGEDQIQHIEFTRRIARRFNGKFGDTFPEPKWLLSSTPKIMGLDGKAKMSKSLNNNIGLLENPDDIWEKLRTAVTDENRKRLKDPGDPKVCNLYTMHTVFSPEDIVADVADQCRAASRGCVDCKKILFENLMKELAPIQTKAKELEKRPDDITDILTDGASKCSETAKEVMAEVRGKMKLTG
jgi:tryptophanyl-tRNA synthetase